MEHHTKRSAPRAAGWLMVMMLGCADEAAPEPELPERESGSVEVKTQALPADAFASYTSTPPTIDGHDEGVWSPVGIWSVNRTLVGSVSSPSDSQATWRALWDASALYVLVRVDDDARVNDSSLPWEDDSIEIYIDANRSRGATYDADDYQLVFGWNDSAVVEAHGKPITGVSFARSDVEGGVIYEVKIPWSSLNATPANPYRAIGFDVHLNDDDDGGARDAKHSWHALIDTSWTDPRTFATLTLDANVWPVCPEDPYYHQRIVRAQVTPVIDGAEDASGAYGFAWGSSVYYLLAGSYEGYSDLAGNWQLAWDPTYLYLFAQVWDDVQRNDSSHPWEDDSVELYIDGNNAKTKSYEADDMQLVFGFGDAAVVEAHGRPTTGITFVSAPMDSPAGYRVEARVPWALIGGGAPTDGRRIGFDVHVNDDDDGGDRDTKLAYGAWEDRAWADTSYFSTGRITECTKTW